LADSSSKIDRETVEYVARLSRIDLSEEEITLFSDQLSRIIEYINQLDRLDTAAVAPLAQAVEVPNVLREDEVRDSLPTGDALANAPEKTSTHFKVPAVLE